jgi:hypothetical protein
MPQAPSGASARLPAVSASEVDGEVLVVVIGAGASFDCAPIDNHVAIEDPRGFGRGRHTWPEVRPPLTLDLVGPSAFRNQILNRYRAGGIGTLVNEVRRALEGSDDTITLENALSAFEQRSAHNNMTALSLLAFRFYLRDLFFACADYAQSPVISAGFTNYTELVQTSYEWASARSWHVCFVTFNYDMLLDEACVAETPYAIGLQPTSDGRLSLLRPHGAVAWEWQSTELGLFGSSRVANAQSLLEQRQVPDVSERDLHIDMFRPEEVRGGSRAAAAPAIALPMPGKSEDDFVWPDSHREFLGSLRGRVTKVAVIGWRAVDDHFTRLLTEVARPQCSMLVVTGNPSDAAARQEAGDIDERLYAVGGPDLPVVQPVVAGAREAAADGAGPDRA